jgi:hypothetical protein
LQEFDRFGWGKELGEADRVSLRQHIGEMCVEHGLSWVEDAPGWEHASGDPDTRTIYTAPIQNELDYLAALHEIGHFALPDAPTYAADGETVIFENEERVWLWTLEHSRLSPSNGACDAIYSRFWSHEGQTARVDVRARMRALLGR